MAETSEKELKRRKEMQRLGKRRNDALSFRLGPTHVDRLKELSMWKDMSQSDLIRQLVDKEYKRVKQRRQELRARRLAAEG